MRRTQLFWVAVVVAACASYRPQPIESVPFQERAQTQTLGKVKVTVAVLSDEESHAVFGVKLAKKKIQPVWLRIENRDDEPHWLLPVSVDPDYYAPLEAAHKARLTWQGSANEAMRVDFDAKAIKLRVDPGTVSEGFVYTNLDKGVKAVNVDLLNETGIGRLVFVFRIPGLNVDFEEVDFDGIYDADDYIDVDAKELRKALEALPRAVLGKPGGREGDPINLVVVGEGRGMLAAFARRGWDVTETKHGASVWRTMWAYIFGYRYRYSPISPLYVFDRPQDVGLQKARATIHERNHLRLWLSPYRYKETDVWVGQISRDIGVKFTFKSPTIATHKIDSDVDESRTYLLQDLLYSGHLSAFTFVKGAEAASRDEPRENYTGDEYFTDGLRLVVFLRSGETAIEEVRWLDWGVQPDR
jgi:hypothetical protein